MSMSDTTKKLDAMIGDVPVIPVIALEYVKDAVPMAEAFRDGGLNVLEITLRTPAALDVIRTIKTEVSGVKVGAGTVLTPQHADQAIEAGSEFIVTPGLAPKVASHIMSTPVPILPGVATASEVMQGIELGLDFFKFFPAEVSGGVAALKAMQGPFKDIQFCPTGGVRPENLADYAELSNVRVVGGTWMLPKDTSDPDTWATVRKNAENVFVLLGA